jgi:hypothetical protein
VVCRQPRHQSGRPALRSPRADTERCHRRRGQSRRGVCALIPSAPSTRSRSE